MFIYGRIELAGLGSRMYELGSGHWYLLDQTPKTFCTDRVFIFSMHGGYSTKTYLYQRIISNVYASQAEVIN